MDKRIIGLSIPIAHLYVKQTRRQHRQILSIYLREEGILFIEYSQALIY